MPKLRTPIVKEKMFVTFNKYANGDLLVNYKETDYNLMLILAADLLITCTNIKTDDNVILDLMNIIKEERAKLQSKKRHIKRLNIN